MFRHKYGGQELDSESNLYYFNARYYDPALGRFLTPDRSLGAHPLQHSALNTYAYAGNNPISYTDPSGKFSEVGFLVGVAFAAVGGFVVAGTDGKILSDPGHAFDNWSWESAFIGAFVGTAIGCLSFGIGAIGSPALGGATLEKIVTVNGKDNIVGLPIGPYLQKAFNSAAVATIEGFSNGLRDSNRLGAYFGTSFIGGLVSSTGFFFLGARGGFGGGIAQQMSVSVSQSMLKQITNPEEPIRLSLWGFTLTFGKDFDLAPNGAFLIGQGASFLNNAVTGGWKGVARGWSWATLSETSTGGATPVIAAIFPTPSAVTMATRSVYHLIDKMATGVLDYAKPPLQEIYGAMLPESAATGLHNGLGAFFESMGPAKTSNNQKGTDPQSIFFEK